MSRGGTAASRNGKGRPRKINLDMILASTSLTRSSTESTEAYLQRATHLHLQAKRIKEIENLDLCTNLKVLYLYDNMIERIDNLSFATNLQYLQLQNNLIRDIPDLQAPLLTKLYLDENEISYVTGLEALEKLEELHISNQRLATFTSLTFDPNSLDAIARTLQILDISGNNISILIQFQCLFNLRKFFCSRNAVADLDEVEYIVALRYLAEVDFSGNPCCSVPKYRDFVIAAASDSLRLLDSVPVLRHQQIAIRGLMQHRRRIGAASAKHTTNLEIEEPDISLLRAGDEGAAERPLSGDYLEE